MAFYEKEHEENPYAPPRQSVPDLTVRKNPWQYFLGVLKKYAVFRGRARRAEYWWFVFFYAIISIILFILDIVYASHALEATFALSSLWRLAMFLPSWALTVRRMHDCDKSGWFMLIPIYGQILLFMNGSPGPNTYGPDPKREDDKQEMV